MAFGLLMGGGGLATQKKWGWVLSQVGVVFYLAIHVFMIATGIYYGKASSEESMTLYVISALLGFMLYHLNREETKEAHGILVLDTVKYIGMGIVAAGVQIWIYVS